MFGVCRYECMHVRALLALVTKQGAEIYTYHACTYVYKRIHMAYLVIEGRVWLLVQIRRSGWQRLIHIHMLVRRGVKHALSNQNPRCVRHDRLIPAIVKVLFLSYIYLHLVFMLCICMHARMMVVDCLLVCNQYIVNAHTQTPYMHASTHA